MHVFPLRAIILSTFKNVPTSARRANSTFKRTGNVPGLRIEHVDRCVSLLFHPDHVNHVKRAQHIKHGTVDVFATGNNIQIRAENA